MLSIINLQRAVLGVRGLECLVLPARLPMLPAADCHHQRSDLRQRGSSAPRRRKISAAGSGRASGVRRQLPRPPLLLLGADARGAGRHGQHKAEQGLQQGPGKEAQQTHTIAIAREGQWGGQGGQGGKQEHRRNEGEGYNEG
eukprot:9885626-Alexandrium_andersonii.AAC.1